LGLTKKLLVADRLATFVDPVFRHPELFSAGTVRAAVVAYSLQIYCDFSGYSDIAIGIARIIGFDLPENFNLPYLASSIAEFWRRWHITLSQWLRDYLYIPLGGNRRGPVRRYINLLITMLLGGLWHGASWNFVLWGLLHGTGLVVHRLWSERPFKALRMPRPVARFCGWALTYAFVCAGWILFRSRDLATSMVVLQKTLGLIPGGISWFYLPFWLLLGAAIVAHLIGSTRQSGAPPAGGESASPDLPAGSAWRPGQVMIGIPRGTVARTAVLTAWIVILFLFMPIHRSPFIYFQF
jgi:alginate O-acetyltransferase complex protein AlgI